MSISNAQSQHTYHIHHNHSIRYSIYTNTAEALGTPLPVPPPHSSATLA